MAGPILAADGVSVEIALSNQLAFENERFDLVLCNSLLQGARLRETLLQGTLQEFYRVARKGAVVDIGEIPEVDENRAWGGRLL